MKDVHSPVSSFQERRYLWMISALLILVLTLPYAWSWLTTPGDSVYSGLLYNPDDQNVHLAWARQAHARQAHARQAHDGNFFIRNLFTTEWIRSGEAPLFINILTWLIGIFSRLTSLPLVMVYHVVRVLGALACVWFFANLCAQLTNDKRVRALATALVAFGSGVGWLQNVLRSRTLIDNADAPLTMPEAWTFHAAFVFPLFIVPMALMAFIFWQTLNAQETLKWKHAIFAGIAAALLANIHTYNVVPMNLVMLVWAIWSFRSRNQMPEKRRYNSPLLTKEKSGGVLSLQWLAPLVVVLFTLPQVAYQFHVLRNSEEFRIKALSIKPPPAALDIVLSYSPYLVLATCAVLFLLSRLQTNIEYSNEMRQTKNSAWLMVLWALATLMLIYVPTTYVSFARKMIEGVHLPLCFLAALGFIALLDKHRVAPSKHRLFSGALVLFLSLSSLSFISWCLANAADVQNQSEVNQRRARGLMPPLYLPRETNDTLQFLHNLNEPRTRAVLCFPTVGNYVPRETGWPVFVGHFDETLHFRRKLGEMQRFYAGGMNADEARAWLTNNGIGFVIISPLERALGNGDSVRVLDLPIVWNKGATTIYRVP